MIVTIFQDKLFFDTEVEWTGYSLLGDIEDSQERYLLTTYALPLTARQGEGLPRKMCDAIRRITTLARKEETGVPHLKGILYPTNMWAPGIQCVMVRVRLKDEHGWWLPLIHDGSEENEHVLLSLDRTKSITVVRR